MTTLEANAEASWAELQTMTAAMFNAASAEEWIKVMDLAVTRHQQLVAHFEAFPVGPENAAFYRDRINGMLSGEQKLQELALDARKQVMRLASTSSQNHRAVGAYLNTAAR